MDLTPRQKEIIEATLKLIAEQGIQNVTIRKLARGIGVTEAAIYRHFSGKADIIRSLLLSLDELISWHEELKGWDALKAFSRGRIELILKNPNWAHVFFSEEIFQDDETLKDIVQDIIQRHKEELEQRFREAIFARKLRPDLPMDILFCMVFGPMRLLIKQWGMSGRSFDLKRKSEELLDTIEKVLRPL